MRKSLFVLFLISLIVLSGINGCPQKEPAKVSTVGLDMKFVDGAPPISVKVGEEFPVYVDILNKGGEYINKGEANFYLSGIGQNLENVKSSLSNEKTLSKESIFPDRLTFAEKAKFVFPLQNIFVLPLLLTTCYDYSSTAQATICISGANSSSVCSISGEKITSNTDGPIQITSLTERIEGSKLILSFDISNKDDGQVYLVDTDCDKVEKTKEFSEIQKQGKVTLKISTRDNFVCRLQSAAAPYGQIESLEGAAPLGKITCEKEISKEDYSSVFTIELRYKYRDSISTNINILPA